MSNSSVHRDFAIPISNLNVLLPLAGESATQCLAIQSGEEGLDSVEAYKMSSNPGNFVPGMFTAVLAKHSNPNWRQWQKSHAPCRTSDDTRICIECSYFILGSYRS